MRSGLWNNKVDVLIKIYKGVKVGKPDKKSYFCNGHTVVRSYPKYRSHRVKRRQAPVMWLCSLDNCRIGEIRVSQ